MKTAKVVQPKPVPEECGVWLDTAQLKEKAKQKKAVRPISKMLNPLAKSSGYSLAVLLNFTQTKIDMPKTKQSSIFSYFSPTNKPGKLGRDYGEVQKQNAEQDIQRDIQEEKIEQNIHFKVREQQPDLEPNIRSGDLEDQLDETEHNIHCGFQEEQAHEMNFSQGSSIFMNQTLSDLNLSEETFGNQVFGKTSTQKHQVLDSPNDDEKENIFSHSFSPLKKRARHEEDSLAQMFTQDSDGFQVIAHRYCRSPFKKRGDFTVKKPSKTLFDVQEALFTQDSQGNKVIKH
ncbi:aurora kinase A and ninein-interacting protein [Corythoichthys intestinalis]|uniref:aurora kinase A and ninein-interacting protein n=1 Tax=Corythoichthys intestinalis TaxID=161448 RepID=UPI0025A59DEA|nr:aurora kinase A and ninein-interacting protein [Corythoichthys intestinalis]XP_057683770.1 aurora kinase A and ninein-interacting protein [Corythoichthys intestinalis]XP_057683771.1 aurora kinase A and ninein-interacting protein [Corythoichthys intestinalis]XP_061808389.1 aurora kinase A- and ninein-interacting protein-like [Nerophis lumbriciformis]